MLALAAAPEPDAEVEAVPKLPRALASLFEVGWKHTFSWTVDEPDQPTKVSRIACTSAPIVTAADVEPEAGVDLHCTADQGSFVIAIRLQMEGLSFETDHVAEGAPTPQLSMGLRTAFELPLRVMREGEYLGGHRVARSGNMWCRHDWAHTEIDIDERLCVDGRGIVRWSHVSYQGTFVLRLVARERIAR